MKSILQISVFVLGLLFLLLAFFAGIVTCLLAWIPFLAMVIFLVLGLFLVIWGMEANPEKPKSEPEAES